MAEYIEREALYNALHEAGGCDAPPDSWSDGWDKAIDEAIDLLGQMPAVEPLHLKPCPFCGGRASLHVSEEGVAVVCKGCYVSTIRRLDAWSHDGLGAIQRSVEAWNARAAEQQPGDE
ncbi:MAG: Lar family restriction alleviation protein [Clostridiales bacterium]|nr:Lar family restriction alleviation protein [Clostridiales bacterium]